MSTTMLYRASDTSNPDVWGLRVEHAVFDDDEVDGAVDAGWSRHPHDAVVTDECGGEQQNTAAVREPEHGSREHLRASILAAFTDHIDGFSDAEMQAAFDSIGKEPDAQDDDGSGVQTQLAETSTDDAPPKARRGRKPKSEAPTGEE